MKLCPLVSLAIGLIGSCAPLAAEITVASPFTDHAVLQRDKPVAVWGTAQPGAAVTVTFHDHTASAAADSAGAWKTQLPAERASSLGSDLTISAPGETSVVLHDLLVGEVWLCSGQSNMEFIVYDHKGTVFRVQNAAAEVAAANYPLIRQFLVGRRAAAQPAPAAKGTWAVCSPATVSDFTAAGYFFARDIFRRLSVPVGIIDSTWGGTPVESWMSPAALSGDPAFAVVASRWTEARAKFPEAKAAYDARLSAWTRESAAAKAQGPDQLAEYRKHHPAPRMPMGAPRGDQWEPSSLYNGMINPLIPYSLRGVLWYQGEANANPIHAQEYHRLFAAMITTWRSAFGQGDIPFYWVQLASFSTSPAWPVLREAQQQALSLPNTGQALAIDIGELGNIHPRNKQEVGRRLALLAANRVYGIPTVDSGPMFAKAIAEGSAMRVRFSDVASGLKATEPVATCELAGADHVFHPATATIDGGTLVVQSAEVPAPVAVRYAWKPFAEGHLYNSAGLPAAPFRSDDW